MSEESTKNESLLTEKKMDGDDLPKDTVAEKLEKEKKLKKKGVIFAAILVVIIAAIFIFPYKSEFERVRGECFDITGILEGEDDFFTIDTCPDLFEDMDPEFLTKERTQAIEAIRYANKEFGFNGAVYSRMLETTALMGRQSEENEKYRVSWTYHPDDGLVVTYEKR